MRLRKRLLARNGISNDVVFTLNVYELRTEFFDDESPTHYAFCIKCFVDQILVVGVNTYLVSKENVTILLCCFYDAEKFSLSSRITVIRLLKQ